MTYKENYEKWMSSDKVDEATKRELASLSEEEKEYRFFSPLSFGTAGLRGTMNAGLYAMNKYTVAWATQGFANLVLERGGKERGVVVCRDSRNNSYEFSKITARVLAANGIKVYYFEDIHPTPRLSFAIREIGAIGGINITASHNPKEYNGYKVYWEDGAQISLEQAETVSAYIEKTDIFEGVKLCDFDGAVKDGKIVLIGEETDEKFISRIMSERVNSEAVKNAGEDYKIVYTPLNGTGYRIVPEVLKRCGLKGLYTVGEQMSPNGDFPTTPFPNPELPEVFKLGIDMAEEKGCDLIIATDPDADRMGAMARGKNGFEVLTGNQMGALLLDYIITAYKETGTMPPEPYAVKTIVSSEMVSEICKKNGVELYNVLTGFKFIGGVIEEKRRSGHGSFIFGYEESYGYLKGTHARDKDAVVATMLVCEMAAYYKTKGMTLIDAMDALYEKYGVFREKTENIYMKGLDGLEKMKALMDRLRACPPEEFDGEKVVEVRDYLSGKITDLVSGKERDTGLPESNVLYYKTENDNVVVIRPSGTEPKIKVYLLLHADTTALADKKIENYSKKVSEWTE